MIDLALLLFTSALAAGKGDSVEDNEEDRLIKEIKEIEARQYEKEMPKDKYEEIGTYVCLIVFIMSALLIGY